MTKCVSCRASRGAWSFSLLLMLFEHCLAMLFLRIAVRLAWQRCFGVSLPSVSLGNIVFCSCCTARRCPLPVHCKPPPHCPCIARRITLPDSPLPPSHVPRDPWREGGGGSRRHLRRCLLLLGPAPVLRPRGTIRRVVYLVPPILKPPQSLQVASSSSRCPHASQVAEACPMHQHCSPHVTCSLSC